jgi:predicted O-linked N-acetylglucosamine transferase (SPINDLY family)
LATKKRQKQLDKKRREKKLAKKNEPFIVEPQDYTKAILKCNRDAWLRAIQQRDQGVYSAIIRYLIWFEEHHYQGFGMESTKDICDFVQLTYTALMTEGFNPSDKDAVALVQLGHIFQHLVAISGYQNNDGTLRNMMLHRDNMVKILFLLNPRDAYQVDQRKLFEINPDLASLWYGVYMAGLSSPTKLIQQNLYRHLAMMDDRYKIANYRQTAIYFTCTYHAPEHALRVKSIINQAIQNAGVPQFTNTPSGGEKKHVAIITNRWHRNHAVYKSAGPLVEQLRDHYRLSLIWTAPKAPDTIVKDYFESVSYCYFDQQGGLVIPPELENNDFDMVYFPDIGMSDESVWLSNSQIAPIQAVGYGHPDTTGAHNRINYFICGDVEADADDAYAEARVCLPGLAQEPAWPTAQKEDNYIDDGVVRINCVWGPDKYNRTLLEVLAAINETVVERLDLGEQATHQFHLFGSPGLNRYAALPSFLRDVKELLPNAAIHSEWEYYDYMREMQKNDFALNSFPFGCYNVLIESLWAGIPFLTLVGDRFYNRAGMWLNDQIGMAQNNFEIPRELINHAADLILNPEKLKAQREHLANVDLKSALFTLKGNHFKEAIDYIFENHPFTETKIIGDDE